MRYIAGADRNQISIMPDTLEDYVDENNICRVIDAFVESLNLVVLGFKHAKLLSTGRPPYHPAILLKLFIYGMLNRVRSSRRLQAEAMRNVEVMWLLNKLVPDDKTICNFRKDNKKAIVKVFREFNKFCLSQDLFSRETVAIDGSKFRANNSRKNIYTREIVDKNLAEIERKLSIKVSEYLEELEKNDASEATDDMLNINSIAHDRINQAIKALNEPTPEAPPKQESEDASEPGLKEEIKALNAKKHELRNIIAEMDKSGENQLATNDPDSRLMIPGGDGRNFDARYNVQSVVDAKHSLILDFDVTNDCNDKGHLKNMADRAKEVMEVETINALADSGYYDGDIIEDCEKDGITCFVAKPLPSGTAPTQLRLDKFKYDKDLDVYLCPMKQILERSHYQTVDGKPLPVYTCDNCYRCPMKKLCTTNPQGKKIIRSANQDILDTVTKRTEENVDLYKKRGQVVEHPFGTIKSVWGYRNFLCKGFEMVNAEMALTCLAYNFRRVFNIFTKNSKKLCFST